MRGLAALAAVLLCALGAPALAQQPTQAQASAIKQACRSDYQSYCASVPTGGSAALQCLQSNAASLSAPCQQALGALNGGAAAGAGTPPAQMSMPPQSAAPQAAAPYHPAPQMSRRQEMMVLRADCGPDYRRLCYGVQPGGGRAIACLYAHGPQLSPVCRGALQGR
jgi:hypothetical protein